MVKKVLILTQYFPPETGAPQNRLFELSVRLKAKNIQVTILTAMPNYPHMNIFSGYENKKYVYEEIDGLPIHRTKIYVKKSNSIFKRLLNYFSFVYSSITYTKHKIPNQDWIICESPPLFLGISALILKKRLKAKLLFNVSDLWPESAEKLGLVTNKLFLKAATVLEETMYKKSAAISGQTQGIVKNIAQRFPKKPIFWLKNGVDLSFFETSNTNNSLTKKWKKNPADMVFFYGGIIGYAQGLEVILKAAKELKQYTEIKFVIMGEGPEKEKLTQQKEQWHLHNVLFENGVTRTQMPDVLSAIDAAIIPLKKLDLFKGAIPSKIFETLAMEKPILLGVEGEAHNLFIQQGNAGLFFEPENANSLKENILKLYHNKSLLLEYGINGRKYVKKHFNRDNITEDFYNFLKKQ